MPRVERPRGTGALMLIALVSSLLLAPPAWVAAQDGTPEPETGTIAFTSMTVIFPAAIQFVAGVEAPPDAIARVELVVSQRGDVLRTFSAADIEPYLLRRGETSADLLVTWMLDEPPYPRPFEPLAYTWTVETQGGAPSVAGGEAPYQDPRFAWHAAGEPPLTLHWHNDRLNGAGIRAELEPVLAALREHTGRAPSFEFAIYDPDAPLCLTITDPGTGARAPGILSPVNGRLFPCPVEQHERVYSGAGLIFVQRASFGFSDLRDRLAVEMAQQTYDALWQASGVEVPAWFAAGLAALYRPRGDLAALEMARAALKVGALLPTAALDDQPAASASRYERELWQAQSALLVRYLADRNGPDTPFEVARAVADGVPFDQALAALDDTLRAALWDTWQQWIGSDEARQAANRTLYQAPVPGPTLAPTATPVPPSPTPSHTPTPAPSPTPTLLGNVAPPVIEMRALPTNARPPTNTPLPPGSLPTLAPRPTPAAPAARAARLDETGMLGAAFVAAGSALVLIGVGLLLRRR